MGNVPGVTGNTYALTICQMQQTFVKIGTEMITEDPREVMLFMMAYRMGRDHKKTEIRNALSL
jgi:hypothetical protein